MKKDLKTERAKRRETRKKRRDGEIDEDKRKNMKLALKLGFFGLVALVSAKLGIDYFLPSGDETQKKNLRLSEFTYRKDNRKLFLDFEISEMSYLKSVSAGIVIFDKQRGMALGEHYFTKEQDLIANDGFGNPGTLEDLTKSFTIDPTKPCVTTIHSMYMSHGEEASNIPLTIVADDSSGIEKIVYSTIKMSDKISPEFEQTVKQGLLDIMYSYSIDHSEEARSWIDSLPIDPSIFSLTQEYYDRYESSISNDVGETILNLIDFVNDPTTTDAMSDLDKAVDFEVLYRIGRTYLGHSNLGTVRATPYKDGTYPVIIKSGGKVYEVDIKNRSYKENPDYQDNIADYDQVPFDGVIVLFGAKSDNKIIIV